MDIKELSNNAQIQVVLNIADLKELLTSSLKKHAFYNLLINNILYLCVT